MRLFFLLVLGVINCTAIVHAQSLFAVRAGTFVDPQRSSFAQLASLGYVHAIPQGDGTSAVFAGRFETSAAAAKVAEQMTRMGFPGATVVAIDLSRGTQAYVVQLQFQRGDRPVDWLRLAKAGALFLVIEGADIKVVTGIFADPASARKAQDRIRSQGFSDAFVKTVNVAVLHPVGSFESNLSPKGEVQSYDIVADLPIASKGVQPAVSTTSRRSVRELQELLQRERLYTGSLDGSYGSGTEKAVETFLQRDAVWQTYSREARSQLQQEMPGSADPVQGAMDDFLMDAKAGDFLQNSRIPIAPAYQAYALWSVTGPGETVDGLMNLAIKQVYNAYPMVGIPPFDFQKKQQYTDIQQLIQHLHFLHHAPGSPWKVPCWLFERHPEASMSAYTGLTVISMDVTKVRHCNPVNGWESTRVMLLIADALSATGQAPGMPQFNALRMAVYPQGLSRTEMTELEDWHTGFVKKITQNSGGNAQKQALLKSFRMSYRLNFVFLEDHFRNLGFDAGQSRGLTIRWLQNALSGKLDNW